MKTLELTNSQGVRWSWISAWCDGGSVAEWLRRRTWNLVIPSSRPALPTIWICSRFWFNSSGALVQSQLVCFLQLGLMGSRPLCACMPLSEQDVLFIFCSVHLLYCADICIIGPHQPMAANYQPTYQIYYYYCYYYHHYYESFQATKAIVVAYLGLFRHMDYFDNYLRLFIYLFIRLFIYLCFIYLLVFCKPHLLHLFSPKTGAQKNAISQILRSSCSE